MKLSDFVLQNLVVHIALAIGRIKSGFEISSRLSDGRQ
ncbi:MAG: PRD domain-containing protein [Streptococcus salivarius]